MSTIAEKYYQQGFEQGAEEARSGALRTLLGLLAYRFGPVDAGLTLQIQELSLSHIQTLSLAVLEAPSLDEIAAQFDQLPA